MKKKKTLIIYFNSKPYYFPYIQNEFIDCVSVFKNTTLINRILSKIKILYKYSLASWKKNIPEYDRIIIFDNAYSKNLHNYFKNNFDNKKVFIYYWNSILNDNQKDLLHYAKINFKVFSFDKNDCKKYSLNYAPMVYSRDIVTSILKNEEGIKYDIFFAGSDKGRASELHQIYSILKSFDKNVLFIIFGNLDVKLQDDGFVFTDTAFSYDEYLKILVNSSILIDIQQDGQEGLTIRIVEAMFFKKKIITNKKDIYKYDFYNPNNIYILSDSNNNELIDFINSPYVDIDEQINNNYDIEFWINKYF